MDILTNLWHDSEVVWLLAGIDLLAIILGVLAMLAFLRWLR